MKKILFTLLSLLCVTSAWAGEGDGTKEHPYTGEWQARELGPKLEIGQYLAFDCVIKDGSITVVDTRLHKTVAYGWPNWSPGNLIDNPQDGSPYVQYGKDNPPANRKSQSFILTEVSPSAKTSTEFTIRGYFTGFYTTPDADGFVYVESAEQMWIIIHGNDNVQANAHAKIRLTDNIYLSDKVDDSTFCGTFYGILDGDGYTIYGDHYGDNSTERRDRNYLFTNAEGATFQNLTFKHIRKNSQDHSNQAIITSQAKNNCVFENITFVNCGAWSNDNNVGAAAGYAYNSTFTNIKVMNSDFTVDDNYVGSLVGDADKCTFTNIEITNCDTYAHDDCAGGVVGHSRNCTFQDVTVHSGYFKADGIWAGGVAGKAVDGSTFTNCVTEDQVAIFADGTIDPLWEASSPEDLGKGIAEAGGIVGYAQGGSFQNCINSAIILVNDDYVGGIVGYTKPYRKSRPNISGCLNTGMLIHPIAESKASELITKYRTQQMPCITKHYNGKEYTIRTTDWNDDTARGYMGGMAGFADSVDISQCANIGSLYTGHNIGGIVGTTRSCYIRDCLSAFHFNSEKASSIWGTYSSRNDTEVANCLAALPVGSGYPQGYYAHILDYLGDSNNRIETNEAEVASGKIGHNLGKNWEQHLGIDPYPTPTGSKGVYYTRNVSNEYGTVCLPYPVQSDDDISYYTFSDAYDISGEMQLTFEYEEDVIPAGTPLLFHVSNIGETCFDNLAADINDWADKPQAEDKDAVWDFLGTFSDIHFSDSRAKDKYFVSDGVIKNAKETTIPAFRAYFRGPHINDLMRNDGTPARVRIVIDGEENEAAALQLVVDDAVCGQNAKAYTLFGTEAGEGYRGIVVRDGKKVLNL